MTASDIQEAAEAIAVRELESMEYRILNRNTAIAGPGSVEAINEKSMKHILVRVRSAVKPNVAPRLSDYEELTLKTIGESLDAKPWEARIQLDPDLKQGVVSWHRLL